jgi:methionyl-tRNA formyltransferase
MAKIVFMGTPEFAIPTLKALIAHHDVLGVVTQPDRPAGRSGEIRQPPVKKLALVDAIPVLQPAKIRKPEAIEELKRWRPDVFIVAAFGQILPQEVLDIPSHGSINVHASLLPRWRGAAPIHAAIRAGDDKAGVTIMKMDAGLDTGPMLSSGSLKILSDDTAQSLHDKLAQLGADLIINTLPGYLSGSIEPQPQPEEGITYAPQIKKDEGEIDWTQSAVSIERLVRAFMPWPGTFTYWNTRQLKIHAGYVGDGNLEPNRVDNIDGRLAIGTGNGIYYPTMLQLEGKQSLPVDEFVRGRSDIIGVTLGHKKLL